ncbi:MAG: hypothetical protein IKY92_00450 [Akkermansia sp.]|nr:hypothetical protein [Akkermansia sp.]
MTSDSIICRPTRDTFVRFAIVLAAFFGFGLYFFYDGAVGYRKANEVFFSYQAFAALGKEASSSTSWGTEKALHPLISAEQVDGEWMMEGKYPLPADCEAARTTPAEAADFAAMSKSWAECWTAYTARMHYPVKPAEHPFDTAAIREQWIAGGVCMVISAIIIFFILRTRSRVMSLQGDTVTAAGQLFQIADISRLDLRQWGKGFKGVAYATVKGRKIRLDGMTYGGFDPSAGQPAEEFMKALLARYEGEILEYEQTENTAG